MKLQSPNDPLGKEKTHRSEKKAQIREKHRSEKNKEIREKHRDQRTEISLGSNGCSDRFGLDCPSKK